MVAEFSQEQLTSFVQRLPQRKKRSSPEILIVEDQGFSRKLMLNVLERSYTCHTAKNGAEAMSKYTAYAPDIAFLDIELPDLDGHKLAALFRKIDPRAYIVMVTANNYAKDVETAKENKVQGFIIKPYNKQKILGSVDAYLKQTQKRN